MLPLDRPYGSQGDHDKASGGGGGALKSFTFRQRWLFGGAIVLAIKSSGVRLAQRRIPGRGRCLARLGHGAGCQGELRAEALSKCSTAYFPLRLCSHGNASVRLLRVKQGAWAGTPENKRGADETLFLATWLARREMTGKIPS